MTHHPRAGLAGSALVLLVFTILGACSSTATSVPDSAAPGPLPEMLAQYVSPGAAAITHSSGSLESEFGCTVLYEIHEPAEAEIPDRDVTVILAHGFMRDLAAMRGWAEHWASHGVRTVVVSFCNSSWLAGRQDRNAADMIAVADAVAIQNAQSNEVVYAGFSAGGLSALLAAASDPRAIAYLGLDAVDSGDLAELAAGIAVPALFILGEPSGCNAQSNMEEFLPGMPSAIGVRVPFATHCDFEDPYDADCENICGSVTPPETAEAIRETIKALATGWVVGHRSGAGVEEAQQLLIPELVRLKRLVQVQ